MNIFKNVRPKILRLTSKTVLKSCGPRNRTLAFFRNGSLKYQLLHNVLHRINHQGERQK